MRARTLAACLVILSLVPAAYGAPPATSGNRMGSSTAPRTASRSYGTPRHNFNTRTPMKVQQQTQRPQQATNMPQPPQGRVADGRATATPGTQITITASEARRLELRRRLAEIELVRNEALRAGDRRRLDDCDRLEQELRARHAEAEVAAARANMQRVPSRQVPNDNSY